MSTPTVERTGDWDSVPFAGGYAGLRDLADDEFSGMVTAGPTRLFMLRGSVIGVLDGDIEDFEDGGGTAREAPHPALPLLAVMQERSEEVRAKYYTEETPLSEVDRTLADGNFTGFIELSENVLSGDYYQVYHQGRSMSVAYVGASERLITDDEAFEQADDEVGIYEVRPVEVEIIEVPEPADDGPDDATAAGATGAGASAADSVGDLGQADEGVTDDAPDVGVDTPSSAPAGADDAAEPDADAVGTESATSTAETTPASERSPAQGSTATADEAAVDDAASEDATAASDTSSGTAAGSRTGDGDVGEEPQSAPAEASGSQGTTAEETPTDADPTPGASSSGPTSSGPRSAEPSETATTEPSATQPRTDAKGTADSTGGRAGNGAGTTRRDDSTGGNQQGQPAPDHPAAGSRGPTGQPSGEGSSAPDQGEPSIGAGDLEVRSLPSLDPARTASASRQERERQSTATASGGAQTDRPQSDPQSEGTNRSQQQTEATQSAGGSPDGQAQSSGQQAEGPTAADATATEGNPQAEQSTQTTSDGQAAESATEEAGAASAGSADLEEARAEVERLEAELADLQGEHEAVVEERDRLEAELAEAREEIDRLRERLEDAAGQAAEASQKLSPREAIDETNLFIRYDSKGEATLEKAHAGEVNKDAVDANMRLEYHTSFDAADAAVDGIDFDTFLTDTVQYRFVDWLVRQLLYEIRDTGNTGPMADLYDALPQVDRAELNGQVGVQYTENGEEHRAQIGFDVIVRDRMGNPLIVANLNDSRDPATDSMMTDLVRAAERVGESSSSLAGAFLVTRSFFEPEALETAEEATAGGLLNRGKQKSFVNLSRKGGYHLCLVEARNEEFHLAVPEL